MTARTGTHSEKKPNPLTVQEAYLTQREIERLMDCARKHGRYGHRDATMILVAYRHGLRASEVCDLRSSSPRAACTFTASRTESSACTQSAVTRCGRCVSYAVITPKTPTYSFPSAAGSDPPAHASPCLRVQLANDGHDRHPTDSRIFGEATEV